MKKNCINLLLFSLITICCTAQTGDYKFYSKLDSVKTPGFYNIALTPEITARLKTDYSDLRITNEDGKWIPHILHAPAYETYALPVKMNLKFSIIENSGTNTAILIENGENISANIGLIITNTAAERFCTLSGSDNKKNWFVINDSILLNPAAAENATENIFSINFPPTNYKFYKVEIHNNGKDAFNIKGVVGYSVAGIPDPLNKLNENPPSVVLQKDSGKISYIKISQQLPFHFDNISLQLSGVKYYNRKVDLYIPNSGNHSFSSPGELHRSFTVSNNSTLQFTVPLTKSSVLYLLINNEDNLPLIVKEVKTGCSNHYITTYLENSSNYTLIMDNEGAIMPKYDLATLHTNIPDSIPFLQVGKITAAKENVVQVTALKNNTWMLWSAIAAALLILLLFSYKMLKEVDKRKSHDRL